jgi:hypothetical protein
VALSPEPFPGGWPVRLLEAPPAVGSGLAIERPVSLADSASRREALFAYREDGLAPVPPAGSPGVDPAGQSRLWACFHRAAETLVRADCYAPALRRAPEMVGDLAISVTVRPSHEVADPRVVPQLRHAAAPHVEALVRCVATRLARLRLDACPPLGQPQELCFRVHLVGRALDLGRALEPGRSSGPGGLPARPRAVAIMPSAGRAGRRGPRPS